VAQTYTTVQEVAVIIGPRWTMDSFEQEERFFRNLLLSVEVNKPQIPHIVLRQGILNGGDESSVK